MATYDILSWANKVAQKYGPQIAKRLGVPASQVNFVLGPAGGGTHTLGTTITLDPQWFRSHQTPGTIIHEMVHAFIQEPSGEDKGQKKYSEGIADAIRAEIMGNKENEQNWAPDQHAQHFINLDPKQLKTIANDMHSGTFNGDTTFRKVAGSSTGGSGGGQNMSGGPTAGDTGTGGAGGGGRRTGSQYHGDPGTQTGGGAGTTGGGSTSSTPPAGSTPPKGMTWGKLPDGTYGWVPKTGPGGGNGTGTQDQTKNNVATFTTMVQGWGIDPSGNITNLIQTAASKGWNVARFTQAVSQTPEFQQRFPGIFNDAGGLKMTPAAYMQQEKSYQNVAAQSGLNIGPGRMAYLFRNDVSPTEFQTRASAIAKIRDNADMFKSFSQQLAAEGLAPKGGLSKQDLFKFVMGEGNSQWYQSYNNTLSRYYGQQSGITFGHAPNKSYTDLNAKTVEKIGQKGLSEADLQSGYSKLASDLTTAMPLSKIQKFGLTKQDLVELEFGGPKQAAVAQKVQMLLKNEANVESSTNKAYLGANPALTQARTQQERAQV